MKYITYLIVNLAILGALIATIFSVVKAESIGVMALHSIAFVLVYLFYIYQSHLLIVEIEK